MRKIKILIRKLLFFIQDLIIFPKDKNSFSIITPCYDSVKYLEDYFESIINQRYDLNLLELILIDDGNNVGISEICSNYNKKIKIILLSNEKNIGQAMSRNKGLENCSHSWVTFIDSDDFISKNYFKVINKAINKTGANLYSTNLIYYMEKQKQFSNSHMLSYRYKGLKSIQFNNILNKDYENKFIPSVSHSIFNRKLLSNIKFNDIKPQFEDSEFVINYIFTNEIFDVCYISSVDYFYRKRALGNSTIDEAIINVDRYVEIYKSGYLNTLEKIMESYGSIPSFVQLEILYIISWDFKAIKEKKIVLTEEEMKLRMSYVEELISLLSIENIEKSKWTSQETKTYFYKLLKDKQR